MEVAKVEHVSRVYKTGDAETAALKDVSLSIEAGEFGALVGPSGSGKTTLLQLIGCLDTPSSGKVIIAGQDVSALNRDQRADTRRAKIGFVFQFFALIPTLTAFENVEMPLLLNGLPATERSARVHQLLEAVGLKERTNRRPDQLSGVAEVGGRHGDRTQGRQHVDRGSRQGVLQVGDEALLNQKADGVHRDPER